MKRYIALCTFFLVFAFSQNSHATTAIDWTEAVQQIRESGPESRVVGTRWAIASLRENVQVNFRLEASNDMKQGGWIGDIKATEKFYIKLYLIDDSGNKKYFKVENAQATGPDSEYGRWKSGPVINNVQMMTFSMDWGKLQQIKNSRALIVNYASYDNPQKSRDISFPLDNFTAKLGNLEASIKSIKGANRFVMTTYEIDNTPMQDLPIEIQNHWKNDLEKLAADLNMPLDKLRTYSMSGMQKLQQEKAEREKNAQIEKRKKEHQAIYAMEPDWEMINDCIFNHNQYCDQIGKQAYEKKGTFGFEPFHFGKIIGAVWRDSGSIIRIYGGSVEMNIDPKIVRAESPGYYYIIKSVKDDSLDLRSVEGVAAQ